MKATQDWQIMKIMKIYLSDSRLQIFWKCHKLREIFVQYEKRTKTMARYAHMLKLKFKKGKYFAMIVPKFINIALGVSV